MLEEKIKQYVINGGRLITIQSIDTVRDGGTKMIRCTNGDTFYIDKNIKNFYLSYPCENLITDDLLKTYLISRIESYINRCEKDLDQNKKLLKEIKI